MQLPNLAELACNAAVAGINRSVHESPQSRSGVQKFCEIYRPQRGALWLAIVAAVA